MIASTYKSDSPVNQSLRSGA